jgi:hemoglobin
MRSRHSTRRGLAARAAGILLALVLNGCATVGPARTADDSLYRALGGEPGIAVIVEKFLVRIADDLRIVRHFSEANIPRLQQLLVEQFCVESGGPCTYTGDTMLESHRHLTLTDADFNALVENLTGAMDEANVPVTVQNRLLAKLAPMHADIVWYRRSR